jgi:allantoicase
MRTSIGKASQGFLRLLQTGDFLFKGSYPRTRQLTDPRPVAALVEREQLGNFRQRKASLLRGSDETQLPHIRIAIMPDAGIAARPSGNIEQFLALVKANSFNAYAACLRQL